MKTKFSAWRRFWNLSAESRLLAGEAGVALTATWLGLRVAGYNRWRSVIDRLAPAATKSEKGLDSKQLGLAQEIARLERSAVRHLILPTNCLEQSMTLLWMLRRRGMPAELRFGARKEEGKFEAHAWVELGGVVLNEVPEQHLHFTAFNRAIAPLERQIP